MNWSPNEAEWQETVIGAAKLYGWAVFHQRDSRGTEAGWPDLVMIRPPELLVIELKSERGKVSTAQETTLAALAACGVETGIWRPRDWDDVLARLGAKERPLQALGDTA